LVGINGRGGTAGVDDVFAVVTVVITGRQAGW
jgi:hypothetical protein